MVMADPDRWADTITEAATKVGEFGNGEGGLEGYMRRLERFEHLN
jgi:hypothetical protein